MRLNLTLLALEKKISLFRSSNQLVMVPQIMIAQNCSYYKVQSPIQIPVDKYFNTKEIQLEKLMGVYESKDNILYALHPELVFVDDTERECTFLCPDCYKHFVEKGIVNPLSLAAGIDHGDADCIGLKKLNIFERMLVAKFWLYHSVVKIQRKFRSSNCSEGKRMHGHAIMFPHDAPDAVSFATLLHMMYNLTDDLTDSKIRKFCEKCITVQFLGKEEEIDYLMHKISGTSIIKARPHVVQQWLLILQRVSSAGYDNDPDISHMTQELQSLIAKVNAHVEKNVIRETNEDIVVRDEFETQSANNNNVNNGDSLSYSLLSNEDKKYAQHLKEKLRTIVSIANACNIDVDPQNRYQWASRRASEPASKFDLIHGQEDLLAGAFPDVFPFGKVYGNQLDLKRSQIRHLLLQYNCHAATCRELIFYLFSEEQKAHNIIGISNAQKAGNLAEYHHLH